MSPARAARAGAGALAMFLAWAVAAAAACSEGVVELRGSGGMSRFAVEVARTDGEKAQGLMNRQHLPSSAGMLFLYDPPQPASFWMKNTLIPLDMIFADAKGVVTRVHEKAIPGDLRAIDGGNGVAAVLEINGGLARRLGIQPGSQMRHPFFDDPAWSCD